MPAVVDAQPYNFAVPVDPDICIVTAHTLQMSALHKVMQYCTVPCGIMQTCVVDRHSTMHYLKQRKII